MRLDLPLSRVMQRVALGEPVKIVAIGSSSTSGAGASSTAWNYPSRLEVELRARFPKLSIQVLNRGVGGEEVPQMLARFAAAVIAEKPDLVIWQLGTNSVLRGHDIRKVAEDIRDGIARIKAIGADVILMDLQFAPRVVEKADAQPMVGLISAVAKRQNVDLFHRFAVMRHWTETRRISFRQSLAPDGLHMNDWSYGCLAKLLAGAIAEAATRAPQTAGISAAPTAHP
jgi:lysophospholipase L1-like esterase